MADPTEALSHLNPLRRPDLSTIDLIADALAALSLGLALAAVVLALALRLSRHRLRINPGLIQADALPERYRLPAYLRLLGKPGDDLYRPMEAAEEARLTSEARARLEDAA